MKKPDNDFNDGEAKTSFHSHFLVGKMPWVNFLAIRSDHSIKSCRNDSSVWNPVQNAETG